MQINSTQQKTEYLAQDAFENALQRNASAGTSQNAPFVKLRSNPTQEFSSRAQIQQPFTIKFSEPLEIHQETIFRPILLDQIKFNTGDDFYTLITPLTERKILNLYITDRAKGADLMDDLESPQPEVKQAAETRINRVSENRVAVFRAKGSGELPITGGDTVQIEPSHLFIHAQKGLTINKKTEHGTLVLTPEFTETFTPFERPATPEATVSRDPSPESEES